MPNRFREIARSAAERTNAELAEELAKLTPLTEDQIARKLPTKADKEALARLMEIVNGSANRNRRIASLKRNIDELGSVALRVLEMVTRIA